MMAVFLVPPLSNKRKEQIKESFPHKHENLKSHVGQSEARKNVFSCNRLTNKMSHNDMKHSVTRRKLTLVLSGLKMHKESKVFNMWTFMSNYSQQCLRRWQCSTFQRFIYLRSCLDLLIKVRSDSNNGNWFGWKCQLQTVRLKCWACSRHSCTLCWVGVTDLSWVIDRANLLFTIMLRCEKLR